MSRSLFGFNIILALALAACNRSQDRQGASQSEGGQTQVAPGSATGDPAVVHHPEPPARPPTRTDSIQIEGTFTSLTASLVQPPGSLPFSAYVPADMLFEPVSSDEGDGYYFFANFGGRKNENAFMLVFLLPAGANAANARQMANAFVASRSTNRSFAGASIGSHNDRVFYVAYAYPNEFGDGMGPRTHYIRSQWLWLDDGSSLESTLQPQSE